MATPVAASKPARRGTWDLSSSASTPLSLLPPLQRLMLSSLFILSPLFTSPSRDSTPPIENRNVLSQVVRPPGAAGVGLGQPRPAAGWVFLFSIFSVFSWEMRRGRFSFFWRVETSAAHRRPFSASGCPVCHPIRSRIEFFFRPRERGGVEKLRRGGKCPVHILSVPPFLGRRCRVSGSRVASESS